MLHEPEHEKVYVTGSQTKVPIFVTGLIKIENAEIRVLNSDLRSIKTQKKYVVYFFCFCFVLLVFIIPIIT